ncbi:ABC transporter permease subunit [Yinghuangia soli]|uniref:ABC transporter permease n=1 Tax=Yinghuangia soli TaxID=2908204 RepID=A0AA41QBF3_9ACTN|nr:ABC transporter permease subunit [Yinghuangia soli]MCF2533814.1 ABC transporter permease [Yinghuangia soli]
MKAILLAGPARRVTRPLAAWSAALTALLVLNTAFWPAFRDNDGMTALAEGMPAPLVEALGLGDLGSPAGYLWRLYTLMVPLLMAIAGASVATALTARDEDGGRYELLLAQPVGRTGVLAGRLLVTAAWLTALGTVVLAVQLASNAAFDLDMPTGHLAATVALCTVNALVCATASVCTAAFVCHPAAAVGTGVGLGVAGYVASVLFPMRESWRSVQYLSPWDWALGGGPLTSAPEWWRYTGPLGLAAVLAAVAIAAFDRRDVHAP